jgi:hypothetical protein
MAQTTSDYRLANFRHETERYRPVVSASRPNRGVAIVVLLAGLICTILAVARQKPPEIVSSVSPSDFSLNNALGHLRTIAGKPHPLGSTENAEVLEYLIQTLTAEGLAPQVQELTVMGQASGAPVVVRNVVARLKGTDTTKAVLLVAHHDTVVQSPGAADNTSSVAALLETMRALKAGPPLKNDVIAVFTDGEECGLLGAHAFVSQHPWSRDAGLVLNFDARGNRGPVLMFETGENNAWAIKEFAGAAPHPFTSSLFPDLYGLLPNNTDFTVFKKAGFQGLNFAFTDGHRFYHNSTDTVENLDLRSVEHLGSYVLSLTRHFGNLDLTTTTSGGNAIYFDLLGATVVYYPQKWAIPLAVLAGALFIGVVGFALERSHLKLSGVVAGNIAFLLNMLTVPLVMSLIYVILARVFPDVVSAPDNATTRYVYLAGAGALTIAIGVLIYWIFRKKMSVEEATLGGLFWWVVGMILTSVFLKGGSYLFTWPLLLMLLAHVSLIVITHRQPPAVYLLLLSAGMLLSIMLLVPFIFHTSIAVNIVLSGLAMCTSVFVVSLFLPLFLCAFAPSQEKYALPITSLEKSYETR